MGLVNKDAEVEFIEQMYMEGKDIVHIHLDQEKSFELSNCFFERFKKGEVDFNGEIEQA